MQKHVHAKDEFSTEPSSSEAGEPLHEKNARSTTYTESELDSATVSVEQFIAFLHLADLALNHHCFTVLDSAAHLLSTSLLHSC